MKKNDDVDGVLTFHEQLAKSAVRDQLKLIGEDHNREGLKETPNRVVKMWNEIYRGYDQDPADILTVFDADGYDQIVLLKDIEMYSTCLSGSTFIETPKGRIPISRIKHGDWLYSWDEENQKMTLAQAEHPRVTRKNQRLWRVYTDKDTILCTPDHKFLTYENGWVEAQQLKPNDSIVALNRGVIVTNGKPRCYLSRQFWNGNDKQIPEHRFVYEELNGIIDKSYHIHHINGLPNDNNPENLKCVSQDEHSRLHRLKEEKTGFALFSKEQREKMKGKQIEGIKRSQTKETRDKRSKSLKKYWDSLSEKEKSERNHRVLLVEKTDWFEDVWNLEVPKHHNFVANGMVVHNCEHHMVPFFGKAHIAYIPDEKVIGISKLARLLDIYARRLQIQERIGNQVTSALMKYLKPKGAACIIEAQHLCMRMRGVSKQNSTMVTSSITGVFRDKPEAREELMQLIRL
ncbi:MAG: GTP cyclohydrolase I [Bacteroidales bacterium]